MRWYGKIMLENGEVGFGLEWDWEIWRIGEWEALGGNVWPEKDRLLCKVE